MKQNFFAILLLVAVNVNCAETVTVTETATVQVTVTQPDANGLTALIAEEETEEGKEKKSQDVTSSEVAPIAIADTKVEETK